ncbi:tyrosine-type recombinase/integrase [Cohaesibacter marisflavi]|uniref:tyrosine-type recombinase/integrase n=1 Tax=Cohaesibacter marisflavi TaxID=655353 RepID=UPI0029C67557|nr:tyrosine-type recombinase/integrase [Cohaesibacter marisflavi]
MTQLAQHLAAFLRDHLPNERRASIHTCDAYSYSFQLLVQFVSNQLDKRPCLLQIEEIDVPAILAFLEYIEHVRDNKASSRNARLAAIKSFFRYLEHRVPVVLDQALRVHAIPMKKVDQGLVASLSQTEVQALLAAPDRQTALGIRDRAMLHLAFSAGLRVSELVGIGLDQFDARSPASVHIVGKGRKERVLPLWQETAAAIRAWITIRPEVSDSTLFLNNAGRMMTRAGFEYILHKHAQRAASVVPSLVEKSITPHVLRHSCAMHMLQATRDIRKVALWLGHASLKSTEIYLRADPTEKLEMLGALEPLGIKPGKFRPPDKLMMMLSER